MDIIRFAVLGLGSGAIYALLAQGLVLIYRGSGILNFAQGAVAMAGAYVYYEGAVRHGLSGLLSAAIALVCCAALGAAIHLLILRPMARTSPLLRVIATLAIMITLQAVAFLRYGHDPLPVPSLLPTDSVRLFRDDLAIGRDQLYFLVISGVLTVVLTVVYRQTSFGRITTSVAENEVIAASLGHSPDKIAAANWMLGSVLAGLAGILIAPLLYLEPTTLVLLVLPAMGAALLGQFASFPITFLVAVALGVASSEVSRFVPQPGWAVAAPFILVVVVLLLRGQVIPLRSFVLDRLPAVGSGKIRPLPVVATYAVVAVFTMGTTPELATGLITTMGFAIICLSVVVITGYAGQLSLAQAVIAGVGALVAAKCADDLGFEGALLVGTLGAACCGVVLGIPALRTRGVTLAIATLGLGGAIVAVVFNNTDVTGGQNGIVVPSPRIFGWDIDPLFQTNRYAFVVLTALTVLCLAVANLRRGPIGRRLIALRSNERAAASLGLPSGQLKGYAFTLSAAIAGVGGIFLAFVNPFIQFQPTGPFTVFVSITVVAVTVVGGVGMVGGAIIGSTLVVGGVVDVLLNGRIGDVATYLPVIGGVTLLVILLVEPDGLFEGNKRMLGKALRPLRRLAPDFVVRAATKRQAIGTAPAGVSNEPTVLTVCDLSVSFGGVQAVRDVDIQVLPGEIHGLIGPNGAGKTTVIDAITGFVRAEKGATIRLGDHELGGRTPRARAGAGLSRSFQSLELFDDLSIVENLAVASEKPSGWRYLLDLVWPGKLLLTPLAQQALEDFELEGLMFRKPTDVSFGQRKAVAIARALASGPAVLLLDEPAAGLDDREADELATLIKRTAEQFGVGILLVEHKVDMITAISDRVTVLQRGEVIATGCVDDVMSDPVVVEAYLGTKPVVLA
jgi:ABC-type branched-subunit amino acid transport system ATPase component/ABC-type branched-subunit amino acid transport system permease subunit